MPAGASPTKAGAKPGTVAMPSLSVPGQPSASASPSSSPPPSPNKTGSVAFFSTLLTTPFASIWGGSSPAAAGGTVSGSGSGSGAAGGRGRTRAAIPFGLGPPPSPSPAPAVLADSRLGQGLSPPNGKSHLISQTKAQAGDGEETAVTGADGSVGEDLKRPPPIAGAMPPEDSPARAVLSKEQLQDLTAGVADSLTFAAPTSTLISLSGNSNKDEPRTPARASASMLRGGSTDGAGGARAAGKRSASASNASSAYPSSAYATLSRVKTRASAASLRASLRNVSGASSQGGAGAGAAGVGSGFLGAAGSEKGSSIFSGAQGGGGGTLNGSTLSNSSSGGSAGGSSFVRGPGAVGASPATNWQEALERAQRLDAYVGKAVFQAGVDYESRPMVVLAACGIPDPKEVDHDALFDRIMATMELFVETDYTLIYFASGGKHAVRWSWIWKTYRRIGRKFRKNLKRLYIVHPTFFTKRFVDFISTGSYFVSPKFARKIVQVQTLSQLATHIPLTQIDIPPEVLQANQAHERSVTLPSKPHSGPGDADYDQQHQMFGVSLEVLMGLRGEKGGIPRVVRDCVEALRTPIPSATTGEPLFPLDSEGLFRRSPPSALLKTVQEAYDRGHPVNLTLHYQDPNIPAALLKVFFRSLPVSIFPSSLYSTIRACPHPSSTPEDANAHETVHYIRNVLLSALEPPSAVPLLSYVFELLNDVSRRSATNRMDAANLATVFAPNLVGSGNIARDMAMCRVEGLGQMASAAMPTAASLAATNSSPATSTPTQPKAAPEMSLGTIIKICIERYHEIFDQVDAEIRPVYGSELSAHLDALSMSADDVATADGRRRSSVVEHMEEADVHAARLQHQLRRTQVGAAGRLASVSESSVAESIDEEDDDDGTGNDGSPTRDGRILGSVNARGGPIGMGGGVGAGGGRGMNGAAAHWRRRAPALTSRVFEDASAFRNGQGQGHGLGLVSTSSPSPSPATGLGSSLSTSGDSALGATPSASPLSPRMLKRLTDADPADVSMLAFHDGSSPSLAHSATAQSITSPSASTTTTSTPTPTPTSASTSLMMMSSPSPASQCVSLPLSPSNRTTRSGKSITGIGGDGFRSPFGAASIGRNSSGSLRLTRDRLRSGSGPHAAGSSTPASGLAVSPGPAAAAAAGSPGSGLFGAGSAGLAGMDYSVSPSAERSFLTGTASAVAVSGASVSGLFASPARSVSISSLSHDDGLLEEDEEEEEEVMEEDMSPAKAGSASTAASAAPMTGLEDADSNSTHDGSPSSPTKGKGPKSRSGSKRTATTHRRGLSEVLEDLEQA
ncbi:hypothetical protein OC844_001365 [Tilletia horrida]|nr:hypothetical protein OC844_001365 [Tilletia horrida]